LALLSCVGPATALVIYRSIKVRSSRMWALPSSSTKQLWENNQANRG
jgi:hypothetical protein